MLAVADTGVECTALHQESYMLVALPYALKDSAELLFHAHMTLHQSHATVTI